MSRGDVMGVLRWDVIDLSVGGDRRCYGVGLSDGRCV